MSELYEEMFGNASSVERGSIVVVRTDRPIDRDAPSAAVARLPSFSTSALGNVSYGVAGGGGVAQPSPTNAQGNLLEGLIVPLYGIIFLLSVIGNSLVLITLARNKRMRTVTNVYLLNLAVSDLLLGVFCMPFTLIGQMLKNFIFGVAMCKLIPYFQAVSVSVGVWTLVAISLERYFAICRPLKSRRWQTQFHAYKMIAVVWTASLTWTAPIFVVSRLQSIHGGRHKCREEWPSVGTERAYNLFLDGTLLLIPLLVMSLAYSLIVVKLWRGLKREIRQTSNCQRQTIERHGTASSGRHAVYGNNAERNPSATVVFNAGCTTSSGLRRGFGNATTTTTSTAAGCDYLQGTHQSGPTAASRVRVPRERSSTVLAGKCQAPDEAQGRPRLQVRSNGSNCHAKDPRNELDQPQDSSRSLSRQHAIRSNYMGKSIEAKKKVICLLFVIVLEFFVCWAPLHVINTWSLFAPELVYSAVGSTGISLVHLLAYVSSCCNPITYCFMNKKYRQAFLGLFDCHRCWRVGCRNGDTSIAVTRNAAQAANNSEVSGNDSTIYLGRTSLVARSEVVRLLEEEDRV